VARTCLKPLHLGITIQFLALTSPSPTNLQPERTPGRLAGVQIRQLPSKENFEKLSLQAADSNADLCHRLAQFCTASYRVEKMTDTKELVEAGGPRNNSLLDQGGAGTGAGAAQGRKCDCERARRRRSTCSQRAAHPPPQPSLSISGGSRLRQ
jgi:hypothetical protein